MDRLVDIMNGPTLNLLGEREPEIYGHATLSDVEALCRSTASEFGFDIRFRQTNAEHELIDWVQEARTTACGIVINAAAYSHTSIALLDALSACAFPVVEVHISNVYKREAFRHHSYVSGRADGVIVGCGVEGYSFAIRRLASLLNAQSS